MDQKKCFLINSVFCLLVSSVSLDAQSRDFSVSELPATEEVGLTPELRDKIDANPFFMYYQGLKDEVLATTGANSSTSDLLKAMDKFSKRFQVGSSQPLPFTNQDFADFVFSINEGKPYIFQVDKYSSAIKEINKRLVRKGFGYIQVAQTPKAGLAEMFYEFNEAYNSETREKLYHLISEASDKIYGTNHPSSTPIEVPVLDDAIEAGNTILQTKLDSSLRSFKTSSEVKSVADVPLPDKWKPLSQHRVWFDITYWSRFVAVLTLPALTGPGAHYLNHTHIDPGEWGTTLTSSALEWQFMKEVKIPFTRMKGYLGTNFWTQKMGEIPSLPAWLNVGNPILLMLAGLAADAIAGVAPHLEPRNLLVHTLIGIVTFGVLSFGKVQPAYAKQLLEGYTSRFIQFLYESSSLLLLQAARVLGVAATFSNAPVRFHFFGADFNEGHIISYSAQLIFFLTISTPFIIRDGLSLPVLPVLERDEEGKRRLVLKYWEVFKGGVAYRDEITRRQAYNLPHDIGWCKQFAAWIGDRATLSYRSVVPGF